MNECFTLGLIYIVFCFTEIVGSPFQRYQIGFIFIAGMSMCIFVHLYFIFKDMANQLIAVLKNRVHQSSYKTRKKAVSVCACFTKRQNKTSVVVKKANQEQEQEPEEEPEDGMILAKVKAGGDVTMKVNDVNYLRDLREDEEAQMSSQVHLGPSQDPTPLLISQLDIPLPNDDFIVNGNTITDKQR